MPSDFRRQLFKNSSLYRQQRSSNSEDASPSSSSPSNQGTLDSSSFSLHGNGNSTNSINFSPIPSSNNDPDTPTAQGNHGSGISSRLFTGRGRIKLKVKQHTSKLASDSTNLHNNSEIQNDLLSAMRESKKLLLVDPDDILFSAREGLDENIDLSMANEPPEVDGENDENTQAKIEQLYDDLYGQAYNKDMLNVVIKDLKRITKETVKDQWLYGSVSNVKTVT